MLPTRGLWDAIERRAVATPEALFAVDEDERRLAFADYRDRVLRCAAGLHARGVGEGTPVSWQLPTWLESMVLAGALARLGAVQNPILPILREREVRFAVEKTGARLLAVPPAWRGFDHGALADALARERPDLAVLRVDGPAGAHPLPEGDPAALPPAPPPPDPDDPARAPVRWVLFTSGTTGEPKGALHSDATVAAAGVAMAGVLDLRADDRVALVFPLTHVGGINWLFAGLLVGCAHVVVAAFDPQESIAVLARHGVTQATAGTVFHQAYLAAQRRAGAGPLFPKVRAFPGGGAPKPPQLHFEIKEAMGGAGIVSGYGMTECPIVVMNTVHDPDTKLAFTEGRPTPGMEVRVVGPDGRACGPDEEGEIRVRGPQLFRGYLDPAHDAGAFDAEGFFRTGDLGRLDREGYLVVTGRTKDVIIRKGENISAREVEDHLHAHPAIAEVAVVGVPDPETGERACAVVVPRDPAAPPDLETLGRFLVGRGLARQKVPERLVVETALPRNPSGKVLRRELQARLTP
ncbi:MAG: AMP-binding protein [Myxococcota bacterium]|nr:AMP-binding protein [Myxococcota bacterium]